MFSENYLRKLADSVLAFANMPRGAITDADAVQQHFPWIRYRLTDADAAAFRSDHAQLKRWLSDVKRPAHPKVLKAVARELKRESHLIVARVELLGGDLRLTTAPSEQGIGVKTSCLLFVAALATNPKVLQYFGQCALPGCKRFFLGRGGRPRHYCCERHQRRGHKRGIKRGRTPSKKGAP